MKQLTPEMIGRVTQRFRALADESRIRLLLRLKESAANVGTLAGELGIAQASVSKHLAILKQVGLVESERSGTQVVYRVRDESVFDLCDFVCGSVLRWARQEHDALVGAGPHRKPRGKWRRDQSIISSR